MKRTAIEKSDYESTLKLYYEEEISGEASFLALDEFFPKPHQREKLSLLSRIERAVADSVHPLLERHGLIPRADEELHAIGRADISKHTTITWSGFIKDITITFPVYIEEFAALAAIAPEQDQDLLIPFTEHEVAGIEFAERELAGDPESVNILDRYYQSLRA